MLEKPGNEETSMNSLEFSATKIPYDTYEEPNAPILASSGDNLHLIFSIPKESFRKLAAAAIAHIDSNSDFKRGETSNDNIHPENNSRKSNEKSKFRLSDVVNNLESESTKDIIDAYEEDVSKSKSEISADPKLCANANTNVSLAITSKYVPTDCETEKQTQNVKMANFKESSNLKAFHAVSETITDISGKLSNLNCHDRDENERILTESPNNHTVEESSGSECRNKGDRVDVLSDHNLDLSDCPELENAWPDIYPFTETEKIPIKEIQSLILNGFVTKYLKLELSNEAVMIKVTSESSVVVDAVKYKEMENGETGGNLKDSNRGNEHNNLSGKESDCLGICADISQALPTDESNVDSMDETSSVHKNESEQKNEAISDMSKAECATSNKNSSNDTTETANYSMETKPEDETFELESPDKLLGNANSDIRLKIEEKLDELDTSVPGTSPTERLKYTLRQSLKFCSIDVDAETQFKESVANISKKLSENSDCEENAIESDNFENNAKCLEDSLDCATESSKLIDSNDTTLNNHEKEYANEESNAERKYLETGIKHDSSSEDESENVNKVLLEAEKFLLKDNSESKPPEEEHSDSALGRDFNLSKSEVISDSTKLLEESKDVGSQDMSANIPCEIKKIEDIEINSKTPDNVNFRSKDDLKNEQCEQVVVKDCFQAEIVTESRKLEKFENSLAENKSEEKDIAQNQSTDDETSAENGYETNSAGFESKSNDKLNSVKKEVENAPEIINTANKASDPENGEAHCQKSFEKESVQAITRYLEDSVSETTDTESLPEHSFTSNTDSFMDQPVEDNVEITSEGGDFESDDVKSIASESDDSRDSDKRSSIRRNGVKNTEADEVDCAPKRTRRKAFHGLSKDAIPENTELKSIKMYNRPVSALDTPSKYSGRVSPIGRSLRSKSLDPDQNKGNLYDKKHDGIVESEEPTRRTRAKTPDIIGKKDIKTTARSSPRKLGKSSTVEPSSNSKVQSTKSNVEDSKSRANLNISSSTKRSKRNSKE